MGWNFFAEALLNAKEVGAPAAKAVDIVATMNTIYFWAAVVAVVVIVIAGFYYVTSMDNAQRVAQAKNAILGAVIGLVIVLAAFAITQFVMKGASVQGNPDKGNTKGAS